MKAKLMSTYNRPAGFRIITWILTNDSICSKTSRILVQTIEIQLSLRNDKRFEKFTTFQEEEKTLLM